MSTHLGRFITIAMLTIMLVPFSASAKTELTQEPDFFCGRLRTVEYYLPGRNAIISGNAITENWTDQTYLISRNMDTLPLIYDATYCVVYPSYEEANIDEFIATDRNYNEELTIYQEVTYWDDLYLTGSECPDSQYRAEYYSNMNWSGEPVMVLCENWPIAHNWKKEAPSKSVGKDIFSVRWIGQSTISPGKYVFWLAADDRMQFWLEYGSELSDQVFQGKKEFTADIKNNYNSTTPIHIRVDYQENVGNASAEFGWRRPSNKPKPQPTSEPKPYPYP